MTQQTAYSSPLPLIGQSRSMTHLRDKVRRYARSTAPVLVLGETGVGKDVVARSLHHASPRRSRPFIPVNCGAIPRDLVEAELFGNVPGAFTGARSREGWFRRAHGGTLFLDEIGDLPPSAQVVLLRAIESGEVWPVGADRSRAVDVRLLCATHRPLTEMVDEGVFRADLYHRLAGLTVHVPPLRDRMDDVDGLLEHFFGLATARLTRCAWQRIHAYPWPGNVRQLKNTLNAGFIEAEGGPVTALHLNLASTPTHSVAKMSSQPLRTYIAQYVIEIFGQCNGNVRATARTLEVSPTTVYRYLSLVTPFVAES